MKEIDVIKKLDIIVLAEDVLLKEFKIYVIMIRIIIVNMIMIMINVKIKRSLLLL